MWVACVYIYTLVKKKFRQDEILTATVYPLPFFSDNLRSAVRTEGKPPFETDTVGGAPL